MLGLPRDLFDDLVRAYDEFRWAAAELFLATKEDSFLVAARMDGSQSADVPSWSSVGTLGLVSLAEHVRELPNAQYAAVIRKRLVGLADSLRATADSTAYGIAQFLDSTWAGTGIAKTSDGYRQIDAGLIYIENRYGSPCSAWARP